MGLFDFFKKNNVPEAKQVEAVLPKIKPSNVKFKTEVISDRQNDIENYYKNLCSGIKPYQGMTNSMIIEENCFPIFELNTEYEQDLVSFIKNTDTVEVHHSSLGHIGFIPKKDVNRISKIIDSNENTVLSRFNGGTYKTAEDENEEKIITKKSPYGLYVKIQYFK